MLCSSSGHICGIISRVDGERGVHKAPANEWVMGIAGCLKQSIVWNKVNIMIVVSALFETSKTEVFVYGVLVLLRHVPTLSGNHQRSSFVHPDRTISYLGSQWAYFEPNDQTLCQKLMWSH